MHVCKYDTLIKYVHIHIYVIIMKKEYMNLKKSKERYIEEFEGRKGKGEM